MNNMLLIQDVEILAGRLSDAGGRCNNPAVIKKFLGSSARWQVGPWHTTAEDRAVRLGIRRAAQRIGCDGAWVDDLTRAAIRAAHRAHPHASAGIGGSADDDLTGLGAGAAFGVAGVTSLNFAFFGPSLAAAGAGLAIGPVLGIALMVLAIAAVDPARGGRRIGDLTELIGDWVDTFGARVWWEFDRAYRAAFD